MPAQIVPVIMCGGAGTRLRPVSRESMPKQFVPLVDPNRPSSRFLRAFRTPSCFARPIVITNADFRFVVAEPLRERVVAADIVLEPIRRDSDPAVAVAAVLAPERDRFRLTPEETAANEEALRCAVLTLWQTSMLRGNRLKVID